MSVHESCDICGDEVMKNFSDRKYRVTQVKHGYDGMNRFLDRRELDVCPKCMERVTRKMDDLRKSQNGTVEMKDGRITFNGAELLTGVEWLARFDKEMGDNATRCGGCSCDAMQAARRAARNRG